MTSAGKAGSGYVQRRPAPGRPTQGGRQAAAVIGCVLVMLAAGAAVAAAPADPHAHHHAEANAAVQRSEVDYRTPDVSLVREDGMRVSLPRELDDGRPVVMNFIYTDCTTICPLSSQVFAQLQAALGAERDHVHFVSISIDPERDTPARLRAYATKFHAAREWNHYTGSTAASLAAQRAYDVYRGDKMSHTPVTLMRAAPGKPWVRLDGFATSQDLLAEYRSWHSGS